MLLQFSYEYIRPFVHHYEFKYMCVFNVYMNEINRTPEKFPNIYTMILINWYAGGKWEYEQLKDNFVK